ncbi:MAG: metallophosphoesterase [Halobacteriota archaeon]|nr:metallophosphoesterase [Halobacteriota archaeon]
MVEILPIPDEPAIVVENEIKVLVISDIHFGIERDLRRSGINIPSRTDKVISRILSLVESVKPERVVILGDLKHNIPWTSWQEKDEIPPFLKRLSEEATIDIAIGNHDGNLDKLVPKSSDIFLHKPQGFVLDGIGYFHGHAWPGSDLFRCEYLLMGHNHPIIKLTDPLGYVKTIQVWLRAKLKRDVIYSHYGNMQYEDPSLIVMPAFNELCGGIPVNSTEGRRLLGPLFKSEAVDIDSADIYLIDGINIGDVRAVRYPL